MEIPKTKRALRNEIAILTNDVLAKKKENEKLSDIIIELTSEVDNQYARMQKAIKYIQEKKVLFTDESEELLKILAGEDK